MLFAKMAEKRNVTDLIMNVGAGGGGGAPVAAAAPAAGGGAAAAPAAEEKKKVNEIATIDEIILLTNKWYKIDLILVLQDEPAEESDGDLGFGLFD